jgi:uncharacterized membrane protein YraQ (UPF0718 family)
MFDLMQIRLCGGLLRIVHAVIEASPTLVCGLIIAGVLRRMVGPREVCRLFGVGRRSELPRAWILGMLLPVCSLGVIPVARELRRSGVPASTVLAFALSAPLLNPMSVLYGLTLSEPWLIFAFVMGSLVVALGAGLAWKRWFAASSDIPSAEVEPPRRPGLGRLVAVVASAAREAAGPTLAYCAIALLGVGLLSMLVPATSLQHLMRHDDLRSPALMALIAFPVYASPMKAMMVLGLMFEHGNSAGASYVFFVLGAGVNLGVVAWAAATYGIRRALPWFALVVGLTLALGYACERPLYFSPHEEDHTHAFDEFCCQFLDNGGGFDRGIILTNLADRLQAYEIVSLAALACLLLLGAALRLRGQRQTVSAPEEPLPSKALRPWERPIPGPVLGVIALVGFAFLATIGAYVYYPEARTVFEEVRGVKANALTAVLSGDKPVAIRSIRIWDDLTRRLEVGVFLRRGKLSLDERLRADELRDRLEEVRDALNAGKYADAKAMVWKVEKAHERCRDAYMDE